MRPVIVLSLAISAFGAPLSDKPLQSYFSREVEEISAACLTGINSKEGWEQRRATLRAELFEMLGLDPARERTDLKPVVTGRVEREGVVVEKLHFQSSPGLYVTANLYLPAKVDQALPTVLYVCGHALVKTNGVSYGNKVGYQHHGAWFARNGYACLTIDTIQLGEIEGMHHGTYREGMWWWNSRGYTPAGVEAWNCIRALDYLETRPEVDNTRLGVTGRSGGGAYSWWVAALDDRIKVAAPVAGITDLQDHVVDGVVEGHCDCMYFVNTYRWDYPAVAALVAPRPLLIANSDKDSIFPLDGVVRTHEKIAHIYGLYGASAKLGLLITEGPHKDTQDLQLPVFRWFNRHLKGEDTLIEMAARPLFTPQELKVFDKIPEDQVTSRIHESFVPTAKATGEPRLDRLDELRSILREKVFAGWPKNKAPFNAEEREFQNGWKEIAFDSEEGVRLKLFYSQSERDDQVAKLLVRTKEPDERELSSSQAAAILVVRAGPEGDGEGKVRSAIQVRRRYNLVGQTLEGMRVWDIIRGIELFRSRDRGQGRLIVCGKDQQADNALMARVMMPANSRLEVEFQDRVNTPEEQRADYLNFRRFTSWEELSYLSSAAKVNGNVP